MQHPIHTKMKAPFACDIFVHTPSNVYSMKQISSTIFISQLKARVELRTGIPAEYQILTLSGCTLENERMVAETQIKRGSVVRLLFSTKIAEKLFELASIEDIVGLLNAGIQIISPSEASSYGEKERLVAWNQHAMQRAFLAICVASFNGSLELLANLLEYCVVDLNQVTACGRSVLHLAAARGSIGCVCLLLDKGIDACIQDDDGKTAQDIAAEFGHVHCKRRIWLYRWNIKPVLSTNKKRSGQRGDNVRFPALDAPVTPSSSTISFLDDNNEDNKELPNVHFKKSMNTFKRPQEINLDVIQQKARPPTTEVFKRDVETPKPVLYEMESISSTDSSEDTTAKEQGDEKKEMQLLLRLAQKYGYTIVESIKVTEEDPQQSKEDTRNVAHEASAGIEGSTGMVDVNELCLSEDDANSKLSMEKSETERANGGSENIRRISLLAKKKDLKKPITQREEETKGKRPILYADVSIAVASSRSFAEPDVIAKDIHNKKQDDFSNVPDSLYEKQNSRCNQDSNGPNDNKPKEQTNEASIEQELNKKDIVARLGQLELRTESCSSRRESRSTFQLWLERKSKQKRSESLKDSRNSNEREKRQDLCNQAFKNWLQLKRVRYRSASVSPRPPSRDEARGLTRPKSGLSFETWVKNKGKVQPRSFSVIEKTSHIPIKRAYSSGVTYDEWINSKKTQLKQEITEEEYGSANKRGGKTRANGMTFESWVEAKTKQFQIERVQRATDKMREEYENEMEIETRLKNGNVKTFEEWQLEKSLEDRIRRAKEKKERKSTRKNRKKFEEDSRLVYDMWLMNKHLNEMETEEQHLQELREEWERKKRSQLKSGLKSTTIASL